MLRLTPTCTSSRCEVLKSSVINFVSTALSSAGCIFCKKLITWVEFSDCVGACLLSKLRLE